MKRHQPVNIEWSLLLTFLMLAGGITVMGLHYLNRSQANARSVAQAELEAIADLKVQQLVNWRNERLGDANVIFDLPTLALRVREFLANPTGEAARREITGLLTVLQRSYQFQRLLVLDPDLNLRLSVPPATQEIAIATREAAREAVRRREIVFTDLYRATEGSDIGIDLVVPLLVRGQPGGKPDSRSAFPPVLGEAPAGVIILHFDPQKFIYPLIQAWPTPSPTAETLLVRREGQEVLYLNELRHRKGTAMRLRRSLEDSWLPAAMGLRARGVLTKASITEVCGW